MRHEHMLLLCRRRPAVTDECDIKFQASDFAMDPRTAAPPRAPRIDTERRRLGRLEVWKHRMAIQDLSDLSSHVALVCRCQTEDVQSRQPTARDANTCRWSEEYEYIVHLGTSAASS